MAKNLETKIKEAKNEEELLKVLESADVEELTDEELELICGGGENAKTCTGTDQSIFICTNNLTYYSTPNRQ